MKKKVRIFRIKKLLPTDLTWEEKNSADYLNHPDDDSKLRNFVEKQKHKSKGRVCLFCGTDKNLTEHHIIPKSLGGINAKKNKRLICEQCHPKLHTLLDPVIKYLVTLMEYLKTGNEMKMKIGFVRTNHKKGDDKNVPDKTETD